MKNIIDRFYGKAFQTDDIVDKYGIIMFTRNFKYLGSWISYDQYDNYDVEFRIKKTNQAMGTLNIFWNSDQVDICAKFNIYLALPINLLLLGCESWALSKILLKKLEVFYMQYLLRILHIKWDEVGEDKIANISVRAKFNDIGSIETISTKRRFLFLGKIIRMPFKCIPARLITTFLENKRPIARPKVTSHY